MALCHTNIPALLWVPSHFFSGYTVYARVWRASRPIIPYTSSKLLPETLSHFQLFLALFSGGLVGLLLGATGGGGSLVAIPLLVYVVGLPVQMATTLSLIVVGYSALFGAWQESRHQHVHLRAAFLFSLTGVIGAWIGAQGHKLVTESVVLFLFGNLLLIISFWTFWQKPHTGPPHPETGCAHQFSWACAIKGLIIGWTVGLLIGFFGVGGGFLIVPALMLMMDFPIRLAIGTSFLTIACISLGGILGHLHITQLNFLLTGLLLTGSFFGLWIGSRLTRSVSTMHLRKAVAILIGLMGFGLLLDTTLTLFF
jgi:uncharacterized protein